MIKAFNSVKRKELLTQTGIAGYDDLRSVAAIEVGAGADSFKADQSGIWLGANKWADAPFRVDMDGNLVASAATLAGFSKIYIWKQDGIPTSTAIGDLWVDTNDSNKVYRAAAVGADEITAGEWEEVTTDSILKTIADQNLSGDFVLGGTTGGYVKVDGANKRIIIDDNTTVRVVLGDA